MLQDPQATHVAGYQAFRAMGRQVRRGETGIKVLAPITRSEPRLDDAGQPVADDPNLNGSLAFYRLGRKPA